MTAFDAKAAGAQRSQAYLQVAARNDGQAAAAAAADLKQKYQRLLERQPISIRKVEARYTDDRFVMGRSWNNEGSWWHRVLIGPMARAEAELLCERLKEAGLKGCFVRLED